ncbi:hypothetical protein B1218_30940 [Pseudomonas ogarae]|nr:hypothetical protein B1218_30940 [Pseudomonas ogarae]
MGREDGAGGEMGEEGRGVGREEGVGREGGRRGVREGGGRKTRGGMRVRGAGGGTWGGEKEGTGGTAGMSKAERLAVKGDRGGRSGGHVQVRSEGHPEGLAARRKTGKEEPHEPLMERQPVSAQPQVA